jgi:plasminogen activator inhibitor 1 RNA-binding protein
MSVASANPFALLAGQFLLQFPPYSCRKFPPPLEEASPPDSPDPATQKKEASASQPARGAAKSKGPASRGGRYYSRGGKPRDPTQDGQEEAPAGDERAAKKGKYLAPILLTMCAMTPFGPSGRRGSWSWKRKGPW